MSDDYDAGAFEDTVERRDELFLCLATQREAFPGGGPLSTPGNRRLRPAVLTLRFTNAGRTALLRSSPPGAGESRTGFSRFEPVAGRAAPKRSSPSVQAIAFKPGAGTCSLGQDGLPATAGRPSRPKQ